MSLNNVIPSITLPTHALVCSAIFSVWLGENQFFRPVFSYNWKFWFSPLFAVLAECTWAGCVGTVVSSLFLLGHIIYLELHLCFIYCCLVFKFVFYIAPRNRFSQDRWRIINALYKYCYYYNYFVLAQHEKKDLVFLYLTLFSECSELKQKEC